MPSYPQSKVQEALLVFLDCGSLRETAKTVGICRATVNKWHRENNWDLVASRVEAEVEARVATEAATAIADNLQTASRIQSLSLQRLLSRMERVEDPQDETSIMSSAMLLKIAVDMGKVLGQSTNQDSDSHESDLEDLASERYAND